MYGGVTANRLLANGDMKPGGRPLAGAVALIKISPEEMGGTHITDNGLSSKFHTNSP